MHQFDELDLWNGRRKELFREARDERWSRSLRRGRRARKVLARGAPARRFWRSWIQDHEAA